MAQILLLLLLVLMDAALADNSALSAKQILQKMVKAMAVSDYQGTVIFHKNNNLEAMKYSHTVDKDKEQEKLVSLNSPMREIIRNSDEVSCVYKATRQVIVEHRPYEHSFIVDVPQNLDEMESSYSFSVVGEEDVAMLPAYVVAIQPKDDLRYVRKIWISKDKYLPLKAVAYDLAGTVLEQVVFTEIKINKQGDLNVIADSAAPTMAAEAKPVEKSADAAFELSQLPKGFKQIFFSRKPLEESGQPVDHLLLSDGFASVSVYIEPKKSNAEQSDKIPEGFHTAGAVNSLSQTIDDSQLIVMGEVPVPTIKFIADNIKLNHSRQ